MKYRIAFAVALGFVFTSVCLFVFSAEYGVIVGLLGSAVIGFFSDNIYNRIFGAR
jgi:hypothetical protein